MTTTILGTNETIMAADAHTRRVTLNVLRYATCCPPEVRAVADRLAEAGWQWEALEKRDAEVVFGMVDSALVERAKSEFEADTSSLIDHGADDSHDCRLCGHQHIRWEFRLANKAGGKDHWTGSDCIVRWGFTVDGEATAEAAAEKLKGAINEAIRKYTRAQWRKAHPDSDAELAAVEQGQRLVERTPWDLRDKLGYNWRRTANDKAFVKAAKAAVKYYKAQGFLTESKTSDVYDPGGVLEWARAVVADVENVDVKRREIAAYWARFLRDNPVISDYERRHVEDCQRRCYARSDLRDWSERVIREIEAKNVLPPPPPVVKGKKGGGIVAPPPAAPVAPHVPKDDISDLPF